MTFLSGLDIALVLGLTAGWFDWPEAPARRARPVPLAQREIWPAVRLDDDGAAADHRQRGVLTLIAGAWLVATALCLFSLC